MFADEAVIEVRAGAGGRGCISFRREKFVPRGGPNGGDGGNGGDVFVETDASLKTLSSLRYQKLFRGGRGEHGRGKDQHGARGKTCVIKVPCGTRIFDAETSMPIADLTEIGQRICAGKGGLGGRGNARFAGPTRQAPRIAEPG